MFFISKDLQPFSVVEDTGFKKLCQTLIEIGAKHGSLSIEDLLYDRTHLSKYILPQIYNECRNNLKLEIQGIEYGSITTDLWTDDIIKNSYQVFTYHFIDHDWKLKAKCLGLYDFPDSKTGLAIRAKTHDVMQKFISPEAISNMTFVTDNGSNMKSAYRTDKRISCAAHNLNLVVDKALKDSAIEPVVEIIKIAKEVVCYFKHSGQNKNLQHTLKQDVATRWNSQFFLLQSLMTELEEIKNILHQEKLYDKLEKLNNIDVDLLSQLIDFLKPFHEATVYLSKDAVPTLPDVWPMFHKLKRVCSVVDTDLEPIKDLKATFMKCLEEKYQIDTNHKLGTLICPDYKFLTFLDPDEKAEVYKAMTNKINLMAKSEPSKISERNEPPNKKIKTSDLLGEFKNVPLSIETANDVE